MMVSEVWYGTLARPGTGGMTGRDPAASTNRSAVSTSSPACRVFGPVNRASALYTSMPPARRWATALSCSGSMRPKTRSLIAGQSAPPQSARTPNRPASRTVRATSAVWTSILDGMQPRFRQVPPNLLASTTAIRHLANALSGSMLPLPAPTMTRS
jgi:hypothetical protein